MQVDDYRESTEWELVWSDEFNGPAGERPDPQKWKFDLGGGGWGNNELQYYTDRPENASLDGRGSLVIRALQPSESVIRYPSGEGGPTRYTSARLVTHGLFEFTYGRVEARLRVPDGQGIWSAFWMLGANVAQNPWPGCGEIDIVENIGREPSMIYGTIHGPGYSHQHGIGHHCRLPRGKDFEDSFHRFAIDWAPGEITWYLDDEPFFIATPGSLPSTAEWVFDHSFFLLLNLAVGGLWAGYPNERTVFPQEMVVDYVRVYQPKQRAQASNVKQRTNKSQSKADVLAPSDNHKMRAQILQRISPRNGVGAEIGVHKGRFIRAILDIVNPAELHLIDPWYLFGKEWPWARGNRSTVEALIRILRCYEEELVKGSVVLHIGYDLDILPKFPDQYFDWVYLDTSHQYNQTKKELELLKLKVKAAGVIAGDDWHISPSHMHHGVYQAVREFVEREPYEVVYANTRNKQWAIQRVRSQSY